MLINSCLEISETEIALVPRVSYAFQVSFMFSGAVPSCPDKVPLIFHEVCLSPNALIGSGRWARHRTISSQSFSSLLQLIAFLIAFKSAPGSVPSLALPL
jgi:hypothetical protein